MSLRFEIFPTDLDATVDFYTRVLGFTLVTDQRAARDPYVALERDRVRVGAAARPDAGQHDQRRPPNGVELVLEVDDLTAELDRVRASGWPIAEDLARRPWGLSDFRLLDPGGYYLRVTQRREQEAGHPHAAGTPSPEEPYYRPDLALVHHRGFGFHADAVAPGVLALLEPVRARGGLVLEVGCGSGLLTRRLVDAGHRVIATDASPAMIELARAHVPGAEDVRRLTLPDDPVPEADAVVGVGHPLNYLPDEAAIDRALAALAAALRPGGVLATDLCDLAWGEARRGQPPGGWTGEDWALVTAFSQPAPARYVREMTTFVRRADGTWRRDHERHDNVLVDTARLPGLLAAHGLSAEVRPAFGSEQLPVGLVAVIAVKPA